MAVRPLQPRQEVSAAITAALVLAGLLAAPVLAATDRDLLCKTRAATPPADAATKFTVHLASSSEDLLQNHLLKPRTDAAIRGAFALDGQADGTERKDANSPDDAAIADEPAMHSASEGKRGIYKRRMYRRDI